MMRVTSRFFATAASVVALLGACSMASAQTFHRHEVTKLEAKVGRLVAKKDREMSHHRMRAAARTQGEIDATRAEIRSLRHR